ncbi:hypothetical protein KAFR_0G00920 [Kazachstania africana CBS 2517]|uniref:NADP-dependent oxidoreductase domain-containing protein n=1 Tax=Kazachstania africana (strain ATCC 22294 / BCRC 22015 / CBS 2517 / CECT 1963 / NBRC 1671 / NRRL Y-8276) TaxID=1071382 RepID=H2AXM5_KAZAF|nr:hypothetical protein KAFR_0G00920 [Kazachstania africana CBS 2517]CCF59125.1 hypothetical protein KAFR_0G00920 [Kazachstania africana CBS 2517]
MKLSIQKTYKLSSNYYIPTVALGTYDLPSSETTEIVENALDVGYRHFDTAVLYDNEEEVAQGISNWLIRHPETKRDEIFYTTKLWNSQFGYQNAKRAIRECVDKVQDLKYIDLLLMHSPIGGPQIREETWRAMQEAVDEGIVKSIGVSNFGIKHLKELFQWDGLKYRPVVNQIEISPWLMRQELADFCKMEGLVVEAYAPLTHGYKINHPDLIKISNELNNTKNTGQILIRWSLQHGYVPLPKTKTIGRLESNLDVYDFELTEDQMKFLDHPEAYEPTDWECTNAP